MPLTRDQAGQPWRARQREILSRIVRETDPPTDILPRMTDRVRSEPDDAYNARVGEVLDLAGRIGAILMASGTPPTATMDQVTAITTAYGIERCEVDVINTTIHVSAYRGPTSPPASTLHIVQSRSMDFSRLAAVDRLIGRIRAGQVPPTQARDELDAIIIAPHPYKRWIATLAWGALAFATAGTLGASLLACLVSALSAMTIYRVNRRLNRHGLPVLLPIRGRRCNRDGAAADAVLAQPQAGIELRTDGGYRGRPRRAPRGPFAGRLGQRRHHRRPGHRCGPLLRIRHDDRRDDRRRGIGAASGQPFRRAVRRDQCERATRPGGDGRTRRIRRRERCGLRPSLLRRTDPQRWPRRSAVPQEPSRSYWRRARALASWWRRSSPRCRSAWSAG